jgi:precorrin-2 dehydrogenase/sirohydrochlorin ferrochelatase
MSYYPLFLKLAGKNLLVVGAGRVGRRKIASVLAASPGSISVVDPGLDEAAVRKLAGADPCPMHCLARPFAPEDLEDKALVFAATNDHTVNSLVAALCAARGILCNSADTPDSGDCFVPAHFSRGGLTLALSTEGQSPALARFMREELEAWVGKRYSPLLAVLGRLRPLLLELHLSTASNAAVFRALVYSPLADHLENGDHAAAGALLAGVLPKPLHSRLGELLHGL